MSSELGLLSVHIDGIIQLPISVFALFCLLADFIGLYCSRYSVCCYDKILSAVILSTFVSLGLSSLLVASFFL